MSDGKVQAAKAEVQRLLDEGFIGEVSYPEWLLSHPVFRPKLNAFLYVCQDQVSQLK
jgi:hypothetical protein